MFAHWILPAIVLLSGFGALVMCLLVLRERHPSVPMTSTASEGISHACAITCFGVIAVLAVIGLVQQGRAARLARMAQQDSAPSWQIWF